MDQPWDFPQPWLAAGAHAREQHERLIREQRNIELLARVKGMLPDLSARRVRYVFLEDDGRYRVIYWNHMVSSYFTWDEMFTDAMVLRICMEAPA